MAQKLLKAKKSKICSRSQNVTMNTKGTSSDRACAHTLARPAGSASPNVPFELRSTVHPRAPHQIALVATYKNKQMAWIKKNGVYNYPVKDGDEFDPAAFAQIKELWLYADTKGRRHCFTAEFVGKMTREEFLAAYPTYAKLDNAASSRGRISVKCATNKAYYIFKTTFLDYGPRLDAPEVLVRAADFATGYAKKIKKAVDAYHADGEFAPLAHYLPTELSQIPRERLRVCEAAVESTKHNHTKVRSVSRREIALVSSGRLRRIYVMENRFRRSGVRLLEFRESMRYVCAGRGSVLPCDLTIAAKLSVHSQLRYRNGNSTVFEMLVRAAAQKIYEV